MKEGIEIKRSISKTANFNPFTLRPSYDEMICHQILWCYHPNFCELFNLATVRAFHEIKMNVVENVKS